MSFLLKIDPVTIIKREIQRAIPNTVSASQIFNSLQGRTNVIKHAMARLSQVTRG
jgi:hypothetical protein